MLGRAGVIEENVKSKLVKKKTFCETLAPGSCQDGISGSGRAEKKGERQVSGYRNRDRTLRCSQNVESQLVAGACASKPGKKKK